MALVTAQAGHSLAVEAVMEALPPVAVTGGSLEGDYVLLRQGGRDCLSPPLKYPAVLQAMACTARMGSGAAAAPSTNHWTGGGGSTRSMVAPTEVSTACCRGSVVTLHVLSLVQRSPNFSCAAPDTIYLPALQLCPQWIMWRPPPPVQAADLSQTCPPLASARQLPLAARSKRPPVEH